MQALLPGLVTAVTLSCGLAALEAVRTSSWDWTLRLVLLAAVADGLDGALARHFRSASAFGEQFDSLADIVAFGAAPAFLFATYLAAAPALIRFGIALAFLLAGAYRLARFHARPSPGVFRGLPITAGGALLTLAVAGPLHLELPSLAVAALVLAGLMVCQQPFPKIAWSAPWVAGLTLLAALALLLRPQVETLATLGVVAFGVYLTWGLATRPLAGLVGRLHRAVPVAGDEPVRQPGRPGP